MHTEGEGAGVCLRGRGRCMPKGEGQVYTYPTVAPVSALSPSVHWSSLCPHQRSGSDQTGAKQDVPYHLLLL